MLQRSALMSLTPNLDQPVTDTPTRFNYVSVIYTYRGGMNTTRKTVNIARCVAIITALAVYLNALLFSRMIAVTGAPTLIAVLLTVCATTCAWDTYSRSRADYIVRMSFLGAAYGFGSAGLFILFSWII